MIDTGETQKMSFKLKKMYKDTRLFQQNKENCIELLSNINTSIRHSIFDNFNIDKHEITDTIFKKNETKNNTLFKIINRELMFL